MVYKSFEEFLEKEDLSKMVHRVIMMCYTDPDAISATVVSKDPNYRVKATKILFGKDKKFYGDLKVCTGKPCWKERNRILNMMRRGEKVDSFKHSFKKYDDNRLKRSKIALR